MARILLVEDDPAIQNAYQFVLTKAGFTVDIARDGQEAMTLVEHVPDLIFCDMLMPGFSGLDFLREAKPKQRFPQMKIIAVSNIDSVKVKQDAMALGVEKYVIKVNLTPHDLVDLANETLGLSPVQPAA